MGEGELGIGLLFLPKKWLRFRWSGSAGTFTIHDALLLYFGPSTIT